MLRQPLCLEISAQPVDVRPQMPPFEGRLLGAKGERSRRDALYRVEET